MKTYVGVDPGVSGSSVAILPSGEIATLRHDATERDIADWFAEIGKQEVFAMLEQVSAMPKQGVVSMFKFGQSFGLLRGLLIAGRVPFEMVTPVKWQSALKCRTGGNKNVTKAKAQELFPHHKWTHRTADAVLLAEYGRRLGK